MTDTTDPIGSTTQRAPIKDASGLLNQWAMDASGNLLRASECVEAVTYVCPLSGCGRPIRVVAASSVQVRPHLRHIDSCASAGESLEHDLAKRVVAKRLEAWLRGERLPPLLARACAVCGEKIEIAEPFAGAHGVQVEGHVGARRADVLVLRGEASSIAIEVLVTHAVDAEKAADFARLAVPWAELTAEDVLAGRPWVFRVGTFAAPACPACRVRAADAERERAARARAAATSALTEADDLAKRARLASVEAQDAEARARSREALASDRSAVANAKILASAEAAQLLRKEGENAARRQRLQEEQRALDEAALVLAGYGPPEDTSERLPPTITLPRARFEALAAKVAGVAQQERFVGLGAPCPRCGEEKIRHRKGFDETLFCFGCGHQFVMEAPRFVAPREASHD